MKVLSPLQIKFLAGYLERANDINLSIGKEGRELNAADIKEKLLSANSSKESLYEYLEDFGHINDPMFDLFLNVLI